jgi:hypothetical protein
MDSYRIKNKETLMNYYGHQFITRNIIVSFMDFFSRIQLEKYGTITVSGDQAFISRRILPVPIQWSTREKWVEILRSSSARKAMDPAIREKNPIEMQWVLPRISVNMSGITYDPTRKLAKSQEVGQYLKTAGVDSRTPIYTPTPYNISLEITTISRHLDDNLQIMEQIIPYFSPGMNLNVFLYPDRKSESIPIILNSITTDNPIDLPENDERLFTNTYSFTVKANYYSIPRSDQNIILNIDTNLVVDLNVGNINTQWLEIQQKIQTKFIEYQAAATIPNPFLKI